MKDNARTDAPTRATIAAVLKEIGLLLELQGGEPFRAGAYARAARAVAAMPQDLTTLVEQRRLTEINGVGRGLASQIEEIYATGKSPLLEQLRAELPPGVIELSRVLSVKKIQELHQALGISSIADLRAAAEAGNIRNVRGFGVKAEQRILKAIDQDQQADERYLLLPAFRVGRQITDHMRTCTALKEIDVAGAVRRSQETVGTLRIVAGATQNPAALVKHFLRLPLIGGVEQQNRSSCIVRLVDGLRVSFAAVASKEYAVALHHETGSLAYLEKMKSLATRKGFDLSERQLSRLPSRRAPGKAQTLRAKVKAVNVHSEADIFSTLEMQYIPPELREDEGEVELALAGMLSPDLVTIQDIRGMTHCHTTYSMAEQCRRDGPRRKQWA